MKITCAVCKNELDMGVTRIVRTKGKDWVCRECLKKANLTVISSQGLTASEIGSMIENGSDNISHNTPSKQADNNYFVDKTDEIHYTLKGINGILNVYKNKIEIKRKGLVSFAQHGIKGDKTIPIAEIKSIQVKPAKINYGYIQFGISGSIENQGGLSDARYDENTVTFRNQDNQLVKKIKAYLEDIILNQKASQNMIVSVSSADELKKFKELLDSGVITQEEFDAKKNQLLGL